ncbi:MAG TPA: hypothetical protein VF541_18365 [Longimicrobium sp.]|jgi:hypothetical protein
MSTRAWKALLLPAVFAAAAAPAAAGLTSGRTPPATAAARDDPDTHNMMLVGESTAFISHLPMFEGIDSSTMQYTAPHRYQVILEVTFSKNGRDVTQLYLDDRRRHPGVKMYTLNPREFVLPDLFPPAGPGLSRFTATEVVRGHLERGGTHIPALDGAVVNVRRVVHARMFDPAVQRPQRLTYILFGKGNELFLAHSITRPPDFDQIVAVRVDGHAFTNAELARGVEVAVPGRADTPLQRIKQGESATAEVRVPGTPQPLSLAIHAGTEFYFEEGELQIPFTMTATPEETRSGF